MDSRNSELVSLTVNYLKFNKNLYVRFSKCLDHDEIIEPRICMSKDVDLSNMLFSTVHFVPT